MSRSNTGYRSNAYRRFVALMAGVLSSGSLLAWSTML
jgi:hypothetical protein